MSSIYRKGRDGYYYYQTYVLNLSTGKKDKRIFHSLGTKDSLEAEAKKQDLDKKYENRLETDTPSSDNWLIRNKKSLMIISATAIITYFVSNVIPQNKDNKIINIKKIDIQEKRIIDREFSNNLSSDKDKLNIIDLNETLKDDSRDSTNLVDEPVKVLNVVPSFSIIKVQTFSAVFDQAKISITVNDTSNSNLLKLICKQITEEYSQYSNLVICLFSNSDIGNDLASGKLSRISTEEHRDAWLGMYTYNPVEGAYFDDKPGGYLGAF